LVLSFAQLHGQQLNPSTWRERDASPRLERLRQNLLSGASTDAFWSEVGISGTPLIEPLGNQHELVTFLWRGTPETRNVLVWLSDFGGARPRDYLMRRLETSDVWFHSAPPDNSPVPLLAFSE
jgi:enterochelin esterase family protein